MSGAESEPGLSRMVSGTLSLPFVEGDRTFFNKVVSKAELKFC